MRLCTIDLFERTSSSLVVFLNGYEHIEFLLNPCKITQGQKVWSTISKMSQGVTAKDPWKGSKVNSILYINDHAKN